VVGGVGDLFEVMDLRMVNISLLSKWKWRLLLDEPKLWKKFLLSKYASRIAENLKINNEVVARAKSLRWKDMYPLNEC